MLYLLSGLRDEIEKLIAIVLRRISRHDQLLAGGRGQQLRRGTAMLRVGAVANKSLVLLLLRVELVLLGRRDDVIVEGVGRCLVVGLLLVASKDAQT